MTRDFRFWETKGRAGSGIYFFVLPMFLGTLGTTLLMNMDIIGVKFLTEGMSDSLSGYYRAALIIAQLPTFLVGALMSVLFPYISKHEDQNIYSLKSIKYAALFILPIAFAIATIPEAFISMMFPAEYLQSATALSVVAIGMGGLTMIMVFTNIFQARNAPRIPAIVLSLAVIIEILSLLRLVPQYGILGAATSTATACLFGAIVLGWLQIRTYNIEMDYRSMLKAVVSIGIMLLVLRTFPHDNLFSLIVDIILCIMIYLIVLAAGNLLTEEDLSIFFAGFSENRAIAAIEGILIKTIKKLNRT
jgi:O-antigen/teichoic acid export membrane protein